MISDIFFIKLQQQRACPQAIPITEQGYGVREESWLLLFFVLLLVVSLGMQHRTFGCSYHLQMHYPVQAQPANTNHNYFVGHSTVAQLGNFSNFID